MSDRSAEPRSDVVIRINNLSVAIGGQQLCWVPEVSVRRGERLGIVGHNGTGKSTLLRVLAGLEHRISGSCGIEISRNERVFVHQSPYLFQGTVLKNVSYGLAARGIPRSSRRQRALAILKDFGVAELANRRSEALSGGEIRRVALARACVCRPQLLLLDEPLADLDESGRSCLRDLVEQLAESTILIASPIPLPPGIVGRSINLQSPGA